MNPSSKLVIVDNNGVIVKQNDNIDKETIIVNRTDLKTGVYIYQFINDGKIVKQGKLLVY